MNVITTYEGDSAATRTVCITWLTKEGRYIYHPDPDDKVAVRVYANDGTVLIEKEALFVDGEVLITFPDNLVAGDYDYDVTIHLEDREKPITILSSKIHVRRR